MPDMDSRDYATIRATRIATAQRLLTERLQARGVVYTGKSLDDAIRFLYYEADAPYGDWPEAITWWLDDQAEPEAT